MNLNELFSTQLKTLRTEKLKLTQEELSKIIAVERSNISKIENGQNDISLSFIQKLIDNTEIKLTELFDIKASDFNVVSHNTGTFSAQGINTTLSVNITPEMIDKLANLITKITSNNNKDH